MKANLVQVVINWDSGFVEKFKIQDNNKALSSWKAHISKLKWVKSFKIGKESFTSAKKV